jgi:hypothetical protein
VKKPKWLGWESSETKSDDLKKSPATDRSKNETTGRPKGTTGRGREEKSVALPQLRQRPPGAAGPSIAAAVPAVGQTLLELDQNPVWRILRLTPHSGDDRCPLFSLDVQLADQSRAEKTRSKSLDLTNHLPSRLSTMNGIGAVI